MAAFKKKDLKKKKLQLLYKNEGRFPVTGDGGKGPTKSGDIQ